MYIIKHFLFFLLLALCLSSSAQDTVFVRSLPAPSRVTNISSDNKYLYARISDRIYKWDNEFIPVAEGKLKYSWVVRGQDELIINHSEEILKSVIVDASIRSSALIPGKVGYDMTSVTIGNIFYLCHSGIILEYRINPYVKVYHSSKSIRHVYTEPGLRIISTYEGIFIDSIFDNFSTEEVDPLMASYSSGELCKIDSNYYLCQDNLLRFNLIKRKFETWINTEEKPRIRKLFKYKNNIYGLFDSAFGQIDLERKNVIQYYGRAMFTDFEIIDGKLFLSTLDDGLFVFNLEKQEINRVNTISSINDLAKKGGFLFLGTDEGLFRLNLAKNTLEAVFEGRSVVQMVFYNEAIIFANNDGLTSYADGRFHTIVQNIEFNRMALSVDQQYLYAGSVFGLYTIETGDLKRLIKVESTKIVDNNSQEGMSLYFLFFIIFLCATLVSVFVYFRFKNGRRTQAEVKFNLIINVDSVTELIKSNKSILSVLDIAENYNTSITQLNRKLKKENSSGLSLLKKVKKEIASEMFSEGKSLEEIAQRVGYSVRYVREKLLSK